MCVCVFVRMCLWGGGEWEYPDLSRIYRCVSVFVCVCVCVYVIRMSVYLYIYIYLSIYLSIDLSLSLSLSLSLTHTHTYISLCVYHREIRTHEVPPTPQDHSDKYWSIAGELLRDKSAHIRSLLPYSRSLLTLLVYAGEYIPEANILDTFHRHKVHTRTHTHTHTHKTYIRMCVHTRVCVCTHARRCPPCSATRDRALRHGTVLCDTGQKY